MDRFLSEDINQKKVKEDFDLYPVGLDEVDDQDFSLGTTSSSEEDLNDSLTVSKENDSI